MKLKALTLVLFFLAFYSTSFAQKVESEGFLIIQMTQQLGVKSNINVVSPDGTIEKIELEKLPAMSSSVPDIINRNQVQLLKVLETYRKKNYELVSVTSEFQGVFTNYLMRKK